MEQPNDAPTKEEHKRKDKKTKSGKLFRKKPLKSVGSFVNRIFKSLGTSLAHFSDAQEDAEDDDGGFRNGGAPCTLVSANPDAQVPWGAKSTPSTSSSLCTGREKLVGQFGDKTPGVLGLKNHGNTCFMNAVVQCLSNTDLLAEYLGLERYKMDLSWRVNGLGLGRTEEEEEERRKKKKVMKGEVTEQLAALVRALWTLEYTPQLSVDFKTIVSKYGAQFRGNAQHDALEFLLWLLDRVHEDVTLSSNNNNQITAPAQITDGVEDLPDHCPKTPKIQHSFVQEHFQAQYKSSLTCPHCLKQSNTFDPFLCISLPIPLCQTRCLCVVLVFSSKGQRYLRVGLALPLFGSVACLRRTVADEGSLSPDQVILTEVYSSGFQRSLFDEDDLSSIAENDVIYAFQAPPLYIRGGSTRVSGYHHSLPSSPFCSGPEGRRLAASGAQSTEFLPQGAPLKILLLVCNAAGAGQQVVRFGPPFLMREDRAISWDQLQQSILSKLYYLMINGAQAQNSRVLFNIRVVGGSAFYSYLSPQDGHPLYHPAVERALKMCGSGGPPHVKLIVEWEPRIKDCLFGNIQAEVVKEADSVRSQQQQQAQHHSCTLDQCFQLYTKEEQLAPDDAWKCPHCKQLQQGMVKMSLWTLPDILILHLKRFRQVGERRNKLTTLVHFPLTGLDMTPHVVPSHRQRPLQHPGQHPSPNPPQHPSQNPPQHSSQNPPQHSSQNPPQHPLQNPPQHPLQNPAQHPSQNPGQHPLQNPVQHPLQNPAQHPLQNPPQHPLQNPPQHPLQNPPQHPSSHPAQHSSHLLTQNLGQLPSQPSSQNPLQHPASHPSPSDRPSQHPLLHPSQNSYQHPASPVWRQGARRTTSSASPDFLYDLYAVCNHHGGMHGGHYTAFCRNSVDGQWYSFDDSSVECVPEAEVCTRGAYILFYQRRDAIPPWSASSSLTGSTSSSASDHWLVRLTGGSSERDSVGSGGALSGPPSSSTPAPESPELPVFGDEPHKSEDTNGFDAKPFVRGTQGRSVSLRSPTKSKDPLSRVLPLRWSLVSRDRGKTRPQTPPPPPQPGELVEYLESGRRPRCSQEPIVSLVATPPLRTAHARMLEAGLNSPNGSIVSAGMDSPRIPEGQRRACIENTLRSATRLDHGRTLDFQLPRGVMFENALSQSAPASRDSTLRRNRMQNGSSRAHKDLLHMVLDPEDKSGFSIHNRNSHENLLSFLKPGCIKKDIPLSPFRSHDRRLNGKPASTDLSKLSYSNGMIYTEDRKPNGVPNGKLVSRRTALEDSLDMARAHSSSNLPLTFGRCASLQRNGDIGVPAGLRAPLADKPGYSTLQWTRYGSTSLVPT